MSDSPEKPTKNGNGNGNGHGDPPADPAAAGPPGRRVEAISIVDEMRGSYRDYSMSVIIGRALPDIRDGLKPVHRRVLYAMFDEGLLSNRKYSKCAGVVGEVLKKYHPHGDASVYDALVRLAQPWNMGHMLVDGQGNFGSVDGDPPAAYRYTEARLTKLAEELLRDIEKNTVDLIPNFDGNYQEPTVLPSRVPNLLINGSEGIAVAMATRCPPHNLKEVIDALLALIEEKYEGKEKLDLKRLLQLMPGPDFPTRGQLCGSAGIVSYYETGRGSLKLRGKARIEDNAKSKRTQIIIDEIPFQVNKARLVERISELVRDKKIEGIAELRDESDRDGMRIAIDLKRDAIADIVINQLFKHTQLEVSYPVQMLSIVDGQPKTLGMRAMLEYFVDFRREVVTRRTRFELDEAERRFHLLAGLLTALDDIDRIITIIRTSTDTDVAKERICAEQFTGAIKLALFAGAPTPQIAQWLKQGYAQLDEIQAQAILEMRLSRLVGLERDKLTAEAQELLKDIDRLREILGDLRVLMQVIKTEMKDIQTRFAEPRRTQLIGDVDEINVEDLIAEEEMVVTISHAGYIKRSPVSAYRAQKRGGKGKSAAKAKDEDFIQDAFVASTHAYLLTFTTRGRVFWLKVHQVPEAGGQARGRPIVNLIQLEENEQVCTVLPVRKFPDKEDEAFLFFCTKHGVAKKTDLTQYSNPRSTGLIACGIEVGDDLISVAVTDGKSDVFLTTAEGMSIRFNEQEVRPTGRQTYGVNGIRLAPEEGKTDDVVSMEVLHKGASVLTVTERGFGKRTNENEYPLQHRAGVGVITIKTTERNGRVAGAIQVNPGDQAMLITNGGTLIRINTDEVSEISRNTQGVRLINVDEGEKVIAITRIAEPADDTTPVASTLPAASTEGPAVDDEDKG
ncbi:MAG: DNA gyrase subunit A [Deltaproteobacteria bacterium]|nr:DNA gyrase subunit A [Deltaproteobacteria bacterium]